MEDDFLRCYGRLDGPGAGQLAMAYFEYEISPLDGAVNKMDVTVGNRVLHYATPVDTDYYIPFLSAVNDVMKLDACRREIVVSPSQRYKIRPLLRVFSYTQVQVRLDFEPQRPDYPTIMSVGSDVISDGNGVRLLCEHLMGHSDVPLVDWLIDNCDRFRRMAFE